MKNPRYNKGIIFNIFSALMWCNSFPLKKKKNPTVKLTEFFLIWATSLSNTFSLVPCSIICFCFEIWFWFRETVMLPVAFCLTNTINYLDMFEFIRTATKNIDDEPLIKTWPWISSECDSNSYFFFFLLGPSFWTVKEKKQKSIYSAHVMFILASSSAPTIKSLLMRSAMISSFQSLYH